MEFTFKEILMYYMNKKYVLQTPLGELNPEDHENILLVVKICYQNLKQNVLNFIWYLVVRLKKDITFLTLFFL